MYTMKLNFVYGSYPFARPSGRHVIHDFRGAAELKP